MLQYMGNQETQLMLGKEQESIYQSKFYNEGKTQYLGQEEGIDAVSIRDGLEDVVLQKDLEEVAKANHKVEVIKMLKDRKGKEEWNQQLPALTQPIEKQVRKQQEKQAQHNFKYKSPEITSSAKQQSLFQVLAVGPPPNLSAFIPAASSLLQQQHQEQSNMIKQNAESIAYEPSISAQEQSLRTQMSQQEEVKESRDSCQGFSKILKGNTINLCEGTMVAEQKGEYYQNQKIVLTEPITTPFAKATFQIDNLKYCVGFGLALKQIIQKHDFNYKSYANELSHGLYIVTSQGYSWSHHLKEQDDILHAGFNKLKKGDKVEVQLAHGMLTFKLKEYSFVMNIPENVIKRYNICFCAYLHQKDDTVRLVCSE